MHSKLIGAILLIIGTCIGAGMLGLPLECNKLPLSLTIALFVLLWYALWQSAIYLSQVLLACRDNNLFAITASLLGPYGKWVVTLITLMFLYALLAAYTVGGQSLLVKIASANNLYYIVPLALAIFIGSKAVDLLNRVLVFGLIVSYVLIVANAIDGATYPQAPVYNYLQLVKVLPIITTAFGFHLLLPSLVQYLDYQEITIKQALRYGTIITLGIYIVWIVALRFSTQNHGQIVTGNLAIDSFAFCALLSSFLGVAKGLMDLLTAQLKLPRWLLLSLVFIPPLIYAKFWPLGFVMTLNYAGIFAALLLLLLPIVLFIKKFNYLHLPLPSKIQIILLILLSFIIVVADFIH